MKAKCIRRPSWPQFSNPDSIYDVQESPTDSACYDVYLNGVYLEGWLKDRFVIIEESLEEQLQSAKLRVSEIEAKIEATKLKIGQKYQHESGDIYFLALVECKYVLICIEGQEAYLGKCYSSPVACIGNVFCGNKDYCFTLLP
jgi:hypothetical protein